MRPCQALVSRAIDGEACLLDEGGEDGVPEAGELVLAVQGLSEPEQLWSVRQVGDLCGDGVAECLMVGAVGADHGDGDASGHAWAFRSVGGRVDQLNRIVEQSIETLDALMAGERGDTFNRTVRRADAADRSGAATRAVDSSGPQL